MQLLQSPECKLNWVEMHTMRDINSACSLHEIHTHTHTKEKILASAFTPIFHFIFPTWKSYRLPHHTLNPKKGRTQSITGTFKLPWALGKDMELEFQWVAIHRLWCRSLLFPSPRRLLHNASGLHILGHVVPVHRWPFPLIFKPSRFQSRWAILWVALRQFGDAWVSTHARGRQDRQSPETRYNALFSLSLSGGKEASRRAAIWTEPAKHGRFGRAPKPGPARASVTIPGPRRLTALVHPPVSVPPSFEFL
jgi:hypothetical protein